MKERLATKDELIPDTHKWVTVDIDFVVRETGKVFQSTTGHQCAACGYTCIMKPDHGSDKLRRCKKRNDG